MIWQHALSQSLLDASLDSPSPITSFSYQGISEPVY